MRRLFLIKRPLWVWLLYTLWVETFAIIKLSGWLQETLIHIEDTNLLHPAPVPGVDWWVSSIIILIIWLSIGFVLIRLEYYGVLAGLTIFFLGLIALRASGVYLW